MKMSIALLIVAIFSIMLTVLNKFTHISILGSAIVGGFIFALVGFIISRYFQK